VDKTAVHQVHQRSPRRGFACLPRLLKAVRTRKTRNPKVIWEEPRRHPSRQRTTPQSPHWLQCDSPYLPSPKLPLPFDNRNPRLIHPSLDRRRSPPQTASGSSQPFCHSTLSKQTDTQTDTQTDIGDKRQVYSKSHLRLIVSDAANKI